MARGPQNYATPASVGGLTFVPQVYVAGQLQSSNEEPTPTTGGYGAVTVSAAPPARTCGT